MIHATKALALILLLFLPIVCQENVPTPKITFKDIYKFTLNLPFDPTESIGDIKEKLAKELSIPADTIILEIVQTGTAKGTGKELKENATRFNHYQPLVDAGYKEILVYSASGPDIKLDPKKRAAAEPRPLQESNAKPTTP